VVGYKLHADMVYLTIVALTGPGIEYVLKWLSLSGLDHGHT